MKTQNLLNRPAPSTENNRPASEPAAAQPATVRATPGDSVEVAGQPPAAAVALAGPGAPSEGDVALLEATSGNAINANEVISRGAFGASPASTEVAALAGDSEPEGLSEEETEEAMNVIAQASDSNDATAIAEYLEAHPDPADQEAFMDLLFQYGSVAGTTLNDTQNLTQEQKQVLANALERAFESGAVTPEEFEEAIVATGYGEEAVETHEGIGELVGMTHDEELITTFVNRELEVMADGDENGDAFRAYGAAQALAGLSPAALQRYMEAHPEQMEQLIGGLGNDGGYGYAEQSPALGALLDTAARIQPPTEQSLAVFDQAIPLVGENVASREAIAGFMERNMDEVLELYMDDAGSLTADGQGKLSEVFARTMFTEPAFEGQEAFRDAVIEKMSELSEALEAQGEANPPSLESQRQARLLGSLVGTIEGGFQVAVDELDQRNQAVDGFVDFLFQATNVIPDLPFPGGGLIKDASVDAVKDWVKNSLHEDAEDPNDAIPFHEIFGQGIDNPEHRDDYDTARNTAFVNAQRGLDRE